MSQQAQQHLQQQAQQQEHQPQQHYSLKWTNHPGNVASVFSRLRDEQLFTDVTLATGDKQTIEAHRVVLSAGSVYLERILALNPCDHPTLVLSNIRYRELKLLLDFMYTGEISVDQPLLPSLLEAAAWLNVKGLYENRQQAEDWTNTDTEMPAAGQDDELTVTSPHHHLYTNSFPTPSTKHLLKQQQQNQYKTSSDPYVQCESSNPKKRKRSFVEQEHHQAAAETAPGDGWMEKVKQHKDSSTKRPAKSDTKRSADILVTPSRVIGCANTGWIVNASKDNNDVTLDEHDDKQSSSDECLLDVGSNNSGNRDDEDTTISSPTSTKLEVDDKDDIPSLFSLTADPHTLISQLKGSESSASLLKQAAVLYNNTGSSLQEQQQQHAQQMVQAAMQTSYLSQLAALHQQQHQSNAVAAAVAAAAQFHGSYTSSSFSSAASNATQSTNTAAAPQQQQPFKFTGLLNTAPVRRYKQYTESSLQAALKEIMEGQSINRSSMKHNIPARTLRDWMKRLNIKSVYTHNKDGSNNGGGGKDCGASVGSSSPEPVDLNLSLDKLKSVLTAGGGGGGGANTSSSFSSADEDDREHLLKIDEDCTKMNNALPLVAS
eukprot:TRINITY_DN3971_c0_g1_i4.p1 TRINITY_DN3971_c0_g1~~TRINITY_DN3971_c0_g1_i4.p1  ORF type:complete len:602 (+),score=222.85 TRINITY_DN3971_c0_g1_i4:218-2023(+)